jgi:hypothetical protein
MKRRLYFLLPESAPIERVIDVERTGIPRGRMHLMGHNAQSLRDPGPIRVT